MLHWQTPEISFLAPKMNNLGTFETVLKLNQDVDFQTRDKEVLNISIKQNFSYLLCNLEPGMTYLVQISLDLEMVNNPMSDEQEDLLI